MPLVIPIVDDKKSVKKKLGAWLGAEPRWPLDHPAPVHGGPDCSPAERTSANMMGEKFGECFQAPVSLSR